MIDYMYDFLTKKDMPKKNLKLAAFLIGYNLI